MLFSVVRLRCLISRSSSKVNGETLEGMESEIQGRGGCSCSSKVPSEVFSSLGLAEDFNGHRDAYNLVGALSRNL